MDTVVYFDQHCACAHMVENNEKCLKITRKVLFSSYTRETHVRLLQEHEEKCNFLAFRSDSQTLVYTQKLVAPQQFDVNLVIFVRKPLVSMIKKLILMSQLSRQQLTTTNTKNFRALHTRSLLPHVEDLRFN